MIEAITDIDEILANKHQWNRVAGSNPFWRWEWLANWLNQMGSSTRPMILVQTDAEGDWTGVAPFCLETRNFSRKLRFLGSGTTCTDYMTLICGPEHRDSFTTEVAAWLDESIDGQHHNQLSGFDLLDLEGVCLCDEMIKMLREKLTDLNFQASEMELENSWVSDLPSTWEEFRKQLSKSMRRKTKEAGKRLDAPTTRILTSRNAYAAFDTLWPVFTELHQKRRKMLGQVGCFADENFEVFLKEATRQLVFEDLANLTVIESNGTPLAASLVLFCDDRAMMYQTGFDVERQRESPGYQIVLQGVRSAIAQGYKQFDFLRGDEPYKARWNTQPRKLSTLRLIPPRLKAKVRQNLWVSAKSLKGYAGQVVDFFGNGFGHSTSAN